MKCFSYKRCDFGIRRFGLGSTIVQIAQRSPHREVALLETTVKSFLTLLAQVAYVIGGHDRLNVGRETPSTGSEVEGFIGKVNFDALVNQFSEVGPVPQVSGATVNLVDDDAASGLFSEQPHHRTEYRPALFGCRFLFFKPTGNLQLAALGVAFNRIFLLRQ